MSSSGSDDIEPDDEVAAELAEAQQARSEDRIEFYGGKWMSTLPILLFIVWAIVQSALLRISDTTGLAIGMLLALIVGIALAGCQPTATVPRGWSGVAVEEDVLLVGSMQGELVALDSVTRERKWDILFETSQQGGGLFSCARGAESVAIYGTPAATQELAYITGYNGKMYAVNVQTGALRWVYPREGEMAPIVGGPTVALDKVFFGGSNGNLYALDAATGDRQWVFEEAGDEIWAAPAVAGDTLYIGSFDNKIYAVNTADGSKKWEYETEGAIVAAPLVHEGTVYIGSFDRHLYALNASDGTLRWTFQAQNWFWARPVIDDDVIYAGSVDGKVYALNTDSGELVTEFDLGSPVESSPVLAAGGVVAVNESGELYYLNAGTEQKRLLVGLGEKVYAQLASSDGTVYVHSVEDVIHAVDARSGAVLWTLSLESE